MIRLPFISVEFTFFHRPFNQITNTKLSGYMVPNHLFQSLILSLSFNKVELYVAAVNQY